jgi:outer membrane protein TolC
MKILIASAFSALFLMGAAQTLAAGADAGGVTLPEDVVPQLRPLLEQAMRQSPRMLERNLDIAQAEADGYMARAGSLPSAGGYLNYQWQQEKRVGNPSTTSNNERFYYNASVNQAVWHWGALEAARKISRIDSDLAQRNFGEAYRLLAAEIRSSYLGLVVSKLGMRNAEHLQRMAQDNLTRQQARYSANQVTYGQIMQDQLHLDETSLAARRARADFEFALGAFRALIGDEQFAEGAVPSGIDDVVHAPSLAAVVGTSAVDASESLAIAEQEVAKAKLGLIGPRYNLFPKVGLVAGVSRDEVSRDLNLYSKYQIDTFYFGTQVNWTIFDGFSTKGQKLAAYTRLRRAERRLAAVRESLGRGFERDRLNVGFTWEAYQHAKLRLRMAREGVDYVRDQLARGEASQAQLDAAQTHLNTNTFLTQSALAGHLTANVQYLSAQGLDPLGKAVVQH